MTRSARTLLARLGPWWICTCLASSALAQGSQDAPEQAAPPDGSSPADAAPPQASPPATRGTEEGASDGQAPSQPAEPSPPEQPAEAAPTSSPQAPSDGQGASEEGEDDGWGWAQPEGQQSGSEEQPTGQGFGRSASFGLELADLGLQVVFTGYGEAGFNVNHEGSNFDLPHFNPCLSARIGKRGRAEIEFEYEHGGEEIKVEYGYFEYALLDALNVRAGMLLVPVGMFNAYLHPSFRWDQVTRPRMFKDVVPAVWHSPGVELFGQAQLGNKSWFEYSLFAVNGLGMAAGTDPSTLDDGSHTIRGMRDNFPEDNNRDKGLGGRVGLHIRRGRRLRVRGGISVYTGAVDATADTRFTLADFDLYVEAMGFVFRTEIAQSFLGPSDDPMGLYETGLYVLGGYRWDIGEDGYLKPSLRFDYAAERAWMDRPLSKHRELALALTYAPATMWSLRTEVRMPLSGAFDQLPDIATQVTFSF